MHYHHQTLVLVCPIGKRENNQGVIDSIYNAVVIHICDGKRFKI
jgi:hypothetical protein